MKVQIIGYIKNDNTKQLINTNGIKTNNKIVYHFNSEQHIINIEDFCLSRENEEYKHIINFNSEYDSHYILKQYKIDTIIKIKTLKKVKTTNSLYIKYNIDSTNDNYEYKIEWRKI